MSDEYYRSSRSLAFEKYMQEHPEEAERVRKRLQEIRDQPNKAVGEAVPVVSDNGFLEHDSAIPSGPWNFRVRKLTDDDKS
jgi:hypothetical protein